MPYFLLPRLSPDAAIPASISGQWDGRIFSADELNKLANGLDVATNENRPVSIDSIPDIWARPIFFQMALYAGTANHFDSRMQEKIKGEWRAILAMLALQDMRGLNISIDAVHLGQDGAIEQTLLDLAPKDSVTGNNQADWADIYVISYNDKPLAITSPTTLVVATADYSTDLSGQITEPWTSDGMYLTDPIPYLTADELSGLKQWLENLLNGLRNFISPNVQINNETCRQLLNSLQDYIAAVDNQLGHQSVSPGITVIPAGLQMNIGVFQYLDNKVQPPATTPNSSAVRLIPSPFRGNTSTLLLVSPKMLSDISQSMGIQLQSLFVWQGLSAVNVTENSLKDNRNMIGHVSISPAQWRRPEEFFTDKLAIIAGGNVFTGIRNARGSEILSNQNYSMILPLKPEILEYFDSKEIVQRFQITSDNGRFTVSFDFLLSGKDGKNITYTAQKIYKDSDILFIKNTIPAIEVWPNFKREGWKKYYLYYENSEAQNQLEIPGEDFFFIYPYAYREKIAGDTPDRDFLANRYTARLSGFPEALVCTVNWTNNGRSPAHLVEAGILPLKEPQVKVAHFGVNWNVGIDFGTSSTMLYMKDRTNDPRPLNLQSNLFQVTDSGDLRNRTYRNFIPSSTADQQPGSFLSIFQMLKNTQMGISIRPLQDGNIFWLLSADGPDAQHFCDNNGRIDVNLKWSAEPSGKMKVTAYIQQICLQILAEAAQNNADTVSWNFSYPTAFSATQSQNFLLACRMAVQDALQDSGFSFSNFDKWAESQANAYCFYDVGRHALAGGAICLDIGAGTTDVSVLSGASAKIVYHTSLQFAGRYLFRSIYKNYRLFANTPMNFGKMNSEQQNSLIDADMRKHGGEYLRNLINICDQPNVAKALQMAQFAVAGIFYYLGGLVGLLHERGIYEEMTIPQIYIGGNGARIFYWICCDTVVHDENPQLSVFKDMFMATSGLQGHFSLFLSPTPKVEVAYGMVAGITTANPDFYVPQAIANAIFGKDGADPLIADSVFAGDNFILSENVSHKKDEFFSAYDIRDGLQINNVNELRNFVEKFNSNHHIWNNAHGINISEAQFNDVRRSVLGAYATQQGRVAQDIFVEPIFILELKKAMEMIC